MLAAFVAEMLEPAGYVDADSAIFLCFLCAAVWLDARR